MKTENKKKTTKTVLGVLAVCCATILALPFLVLLVCVIGLAVDISLPNKLAGELDEWEPALRDQVAVYSIHYDIGHTDRSLIVDGETIDVRKALNSPDERTTKKKAWTVSEMLCIYDNAAYGRASFTAEKEGEYFVEIFALDLESKKLRTVYTCEVSSVGQFSASPAAYYYNGAILLYNSEKTVSINLKNEQVAEYRTGDFAHFQPTVSFAQDSEHWSWVVSCGAESRVLTLDYLAERNEYAAELRGWVQEGEEKTKGHGFGLAPSLLEHGFSLSGTDICLWYYVSDRNDHASYILFLYDFADDTVSYIGYGYTYEMHAEDLVYPIPIVQP